MYNAFPVFRVTEKMRKLTVPIFLFFHLLTGSTFADACHYFSSIKNDPERLLSFLTEMPKGGELHYHLAGGALPETMLAVAPKGNYCLNPTTYTISNNKKACQGIWLNSLQTNSKLYNRILQAWSMENFTTKKESGHDHFFATFFKFSPVVADYGPDLLAQVLQRAARQHELYMEIMILPDNGASSHFGQLIKTTNSLAKKKNILLNNANFEKNIKRTAAGSTLLLKQAREKLGCNTPSAEAACKLTVKFQYNILREQPIDNLFAQALNAFAAASVSNDLIAINLVQAEDGPISLRDFHRQMLVINFLHQAYPKVHIALHAGELTSKMIETKLIKPTDLLYHIHDALLTGHAERLGHGVDILHENKSDHVLNYMKNANIPVEISFTSNRKILNISGKKHPLSYYLEHHVPVVFSTDDEGILRTDLSHEYSTAVTQYGLDYATIKRINRNTLTYNFLPGVSLWKDAYSGLLVDECHDLSSEKCRTFIAHSPKATLQWELEKQLAAFENKYCNKTP